MAKYLKTDKQTCADLSITEGVYEETPLFSLFLKTETKKGKSAMLEWITNPLSDINIIRNRQEAIAWEYLPELPLCEEELDFIEYYLEYREQIKMTNGFLSFIAIIDRWFQPDSHRYLIRRGTTLITEMLHGLKKFSREIPHNAPVLLKEFSSQIEDAINSNEFKELLEHTSTPPIKLSNATIDKYDYIFRNNRLDTIKNLLAIIYQLDVCRTAYQVAKDKQFCNNPRMVETMELSIHGFVHPFVKNGQKNKWKMSTGNISIFTGSNMAGKSTTLKALTICIWLAHCGLPVPAESMVCPVYNGIYTSINLPDSLRDGRSHFMAEILRIKEILQNAKSGNQCLIVLDEMFRGTNAQDAFEASIAVNNLLKEYNHCHFLISTHILEYAKSFEEDKVCNFYYMDSKIKDNQFFCSHQLMEGISEVKVGYWLIQRELKDLL